MKRSIGLGLLTIGVAASTVLGAPPATAAQGPLAGTWTSTDTDGSNQTLTITGSGRRAYAVTYFDDAATSLCDGAPAMVTGSGRVDGDDLFTRGAATCLPGGNRLRGVITIDYTYDAASDTLTDAFGIVWSRA
jgi:hypothetical protein